MCMENTAKIVSDSNSLTFQRRNEAAYFTDFTLHASSFNFYKTETFMVPFKNHLKIQHGVTETKFGDKTKG